MMSGLQVRHRSPRQTRCTPQPCGELGLFLAAGGKHQQSGFGVDELACLTLAASALAPRLGGFGARQGGREWARMDLEAKCFHAPVQASLRERESSSHPNLPCVPTFAMG